MNKALIKRLKNNRKRNFPKEIAKTEHNASIIRKRIKERNEYSPNIPVNKRLLGTYLPIPK